METQTHNFVSAYLLKDNGVFPNSIFPVLIYKQVLELPRLFAGSRIKKIFGSHGWSNSWKNGIYTYDHYHSNTHELMGVIKGSTTLLFGGENGVKVRVEAGDAMIIPAGVAHKNLGGQNDVTCIGAYPAGRSFDMNYGKPGERPLSDENIRNVPLPEQDPVFGPGGPLHAYWKKADSDQLKKPSS